MSETEKKKTATDKPDNNSEAKSKEKKTADSKSKKNEKKAEAKTATAEPIKASKARKKRSGFFGKRTKPAVFSVETLARRTGTSSVVMGALKAAYGWTERTRISQAEFLRKRDDWLKRPVKEG